MNNTIEIRPSHTSIYVQHWTQFTYALSVFHRSAYHGCESQDNEAHQVANQNALADTIGPNSDHLTSGPVTSRIAANQDMHNPPRDCISAPHRRLAHTYTRVPEI